jgi:uncharacterized integral membrane protein
VFEVSRSFRSPENSRTTNYFNGPKMYESSLNKRLEKKKWTVILFQLLIFLVIFIFIKNHHFSVSNLVDKRSHCFLYILFFHVETMSNMHGGLMRENDDDFSTPV